MKKFILFTMPFYICITQLFADNEITPVNSIKLSQYSEGDYNEDDESTDGWFEEEISEENLNKFRQSSKNNSGKVDSSLLNQQNSYIKAAESELEQFWDEIGSFDLTNDTVYKNAVEKLKNLHNNRKEAEQNAAIAIQSMTGYEGDVLLKKDETSEKLLIDLKKLEEERQKQRA